MFKSPLVAISPLAPVKVQSTIVTLSMMVGPAAALSTYNYEL